MHRYLKIATQNFSFAFLQFDSMRWSIPSCNWNEIHKMAIENWNSYEFVESTHECHVDNRQCYRFHLCQSTNTWNFVVFRPNDFHWSYTLRCHYENLADHLALFFRLDLFILEKKFVTIAGQTTHFRRSGETERERERVHIFPTNTLISHCCALLCWLTHFTVISFRLYFFSSLFVWITYLIGCVCSRVWISQHTWTRTHIHTYRVNK